MECTRLAIAMGNVFSGGDKKPAASATTTVRPSTTTSTTSGSAYKYNGVQTATSRPQASSTAYAHSYSGNTYTSRPAAAPTANTTSPVITTISGGGNTVTYKNGEPIRFMLGGQDYTEWFLSQPLLGRRDLVKQIKELAEAEKATRPSATSTTTTSGERMSLDERRNLAKEARNATTAASTTRPVTTTSSSTVSSGGPTTAAIRKVEYEYEDHSPAPPNKANTTSPVITTVSASGHTLTFKNGEPIRYTVGGEDYTEGFMLLPFEKKMDRVNQIKEAAAAANMTQAAATTASSKTTSAASVTQMRSINSTGFSRTTYDDPYGCNSTRATTTAPRPATSSSTTSTTRPFSGAGATTRQPAAMPPSAFAYDSDDECIPTSAMARLSIDNGVKLTEATLAGPTDTPVYTLSVSNKRICVFEPARERFIEAPRGQISLPGVSEGEVYHAAAISRDNLGDLTAPTALRRRQYAERHAFIFGSLDVYRELVLPALLLGSRVRDFEQRCATVIQLGELVLNMPAQNRNLKNKPLKLRTISGQVFEIDVKHVQKSDDDTDKRWIVECHPPKQELPYKVRPGALLEIMGGFMLQPRVTGALMQYMNVPAARRDPKDHNRKTDPIRNWTLLSAIYGARARRDYPGVNNINPHIKLAKNAGFVQLNPEQTEAVARYNCNVCPAFVVESPPGSGKTMTAAAMAVSYTGDGVQLFLSTANVPVINMALALAKLDYGTLKAIHLISSEREDLMTDETRSPFSVISLAKDYVDLNEKISALEEQLKHAPNQDEKDKLKNKITGLCSRVFADKYDIYFGTVDMILGRYYKPNKGGRHYVDSIKKQLTESVRRVVVDEASQLTEAALNALILCFPDAQIVLIGDSKQLPPFRYTTEHLVSALAARPAIEVMKDKMNLPVIKLNRVYRASPVLMAHYSHCFYGGTLQSFRPESAKHPFQCFGARSGGNRCLFWKVKGIAKMQGTSKYNFGELKSLKYLVNMLKNSGYDEKSVMVISYYEAQRKKAEDELGEAYEVLTVDSAQGREKKIVIVLTTRTSVPTESGAFFNSPLRCNVAVSRHQEALIVVGHPSIASAPSWSKVLSPKYFKHVEDEKSGRRR